VTPADRTRPVVVGIGEVLWDLLPGGKQLGGAPANCAFHAHAMGADAPLISAVGRDPLGAEILEILARQGIPAGAVAIDPLHPTGTVSVQVGEAGEPRFTIDEGVAWDYIPASPEAIEAAARADAICFGTLAQRSAPSRATIRTCIEAARPGCLRVLDVNLRDPFADAACVAGALAFADLLKLNDAELPRIAAWLGLDGTETAVLDALLARYSLRLIALTRGGRGSRLRGADGDSVHGGYQVEVVDTVGAGDSFTAAVIMGLLRGRPLDEINDDANRIASRVCTRSGAFPAAAAPPARARGRRTT
jgi:fructokinase